MFNWPVCLCYSLQLWKYTHKRGNFFCIFHIYHRLKIITDSLSHFHTKNCLCGYHTVHQLGIYYIHKPNIYHHILTLGFFFVYKICLQLLVLFCAVVLMFLFLYLIFNCVVLCFVHLKTECVQFYLKKVLLVSFLWLGQLSNDNQKNYLNGCVWM